MDGVADPNLSVWTPDPDTFDQVITNMDLELTDQVVLVPDPDPVQIKFLILFGFVHNFCYFKRYSVDFFDNRYKNRNKPFPV